MREDKARRNIVRVARDCQADASRVSRELSEAVWSVDFGMTLGKPQRLQRHHFLEGEDRCAGGQVVEQRRCQTNCWQ